MLNSKDIIHKIKRHCLSLVALIAISQPMAFANPAWLTITENATDLTDRGYLQYIEDPLNQLSFDYILENQKAFKLYQDEIFKDGFSTSSYWLKIQIDARQNTSEDWLLEIKHPSLDFLNIIITDENNNILYEATMGDLKPFDDRFFFYRNFLIPIDFSKYKKQIIYLNIKSENSIKAPIHIWEYNSFISQNISEQYLLGIYYGMIIVIILYNLFLWISIRDINYLSYIGYVAFIALYHLSVDGLGYQYLWSNFPAIQQINSSLFAALACLLGTLFAKGFLQTAKYYQPANTVLKLGILLSIVAALCSLLLKTSLAMQLGQVLVLFFIVSIAYAAIMALIKGQRQARFFVAAWAFSIVGFTIAWCESLGLLPNTLFTTHASKIGNTIEIILLSLALADRIKIAEDARREAEKFSKRQLEDRADRLTESMRLKSDFLETITHEFKNPISGILGSLEFAYNTTGPQQRAALSDIETGAKEMLDLIDNVITYTELQAGYRLEMSNVVDIRQLISDIVIHEDQQAMNSDLAFTIQIHDNVPGSIRTDSRCISYALKALISNSVQFTPRGSITIEIGLSDIDQRVCLDILVKDTGLGLSPSEVDEIRTFLTQLHRPFPPIHRGLGLGLSITRSICHNMDGSIELSSQMGIGTEVRLKLPFKFVLKSELTDNTPLKLTPTTQSRGRALVIEDNPVNLRVMQAMLMNLNMQTDLADNGKRALEILQENLEAYQLIFMDCQMPVMDGFETTRLIRASNMASKNTPIIATTSFSMVNNESRCVEAGMNDFINKPITREKLEHIVAKWLQPSTSQTIAPKPPSQLPPQTNV